ncbi:MAG: RNA polymerase sigma factor [Granulosicoccus sp.]
MVVKTMDSTPRTGGSTQETDDIRELELIAQQDQAAFESLYRRYHPKLYRFVQRITSNPMQVEEIVSDTLFAVWNSAARFQQKSKVSTWIFGIGFRTAMKATRSSARHSRFTQSGDDPDALEDQNEANDPSIKAELRGRTADVLAAVQSLNPKQRAVVELTALGWSSAEIGEIVGCPANTVKTRMFSARKKLLAIGAYN